MKTLFNPGLRTKLLCSALISMLLCLAVAGIGYLNQSNIEAGSRRLSQLGSAQAQLQTVLRGLNEVIVTEGASASVKLARSSLKSFDQTQAALEADGAAVKELVALWKPFAGDAEAFLKRNKFGTGEDEAMIAFGKLISRAEVIVKKLEGISAEVGAATTAATARSQLQSAMLIGAALILLALAGWWVYRSVTSSIGGEPDAVAQVARRIAEGDLATPVVADKAAPASILAAMATMRTMLAERAETDRKSASENLRIRYALDNALTNIRIADDEGTIVYLNKAIQDTIKRHEPAIREQLPGFDADNLIGGSIGVFYPDPQAALKTLATLEGTRRSELMIGGRRFDIVTNPIRDADGKRLGSVGEWVDRTDDLRAEGEISALIERARHGNFEQAIDATTLSGFHAQAATGLNQFQREVRDGLAGVQAVLARLADGDLTARMDGQYEGAFETIKQNCNATCERLNGIVAQIRTGAETINTAARELSMGNTDLSQRTEEQASTLQQTSASMEELSTTVKQNSDSARKANELAIQASETASRGGGVVGDVVGTMQAITASSKKIVDIISVIDGIAFQTNILALNAAVEAARAGEQGRGFAVVATEVRNLAQRSASAAREIKGLIGDSVEKVEAGSKLVADAGTTMEEIVGSVKRVTDIMFEITSASIEQSSGIEQVNHAVAQMDKVTQQNAALVEQAAAAAQSMEEQARTLSTTVSVFRLAETAAAPGARAKAAGKALPAPRNAAAKATGQALARAGGDEWEEF